MLKLTAEDHARVSAAIAAAEEKSAGEIIAVTTDLSDRYHDVGLHYAVLAMFAALAVLAAVPNCLVWWYQKLLPWAGEPSLQQALTWVLFIALAKFLVALFIMKWMPLRLALTPRSTKARRVRRRAVELFRTSAESRTAGRTGILIYLSMGERRAEIIGDEAITKVTTDETWGEAMKALLVEVKQGRPGDGIVAAVAIIGDVLAQHFPRADNDVNEIPDKLIEL
ncbi:TPM domain-containing protein [Sphingomonas jaspsi]|uniref:TPM domain-containing protein n=1 Tax=Sphingomonas jaspsi TaxID=392409 RepID=UPI0004BB483B|nr:TPM domain-containing protein [Sphingomonas jaspsi]